MILVFVPITYYGGIPFKIMFAILGLLGLKELLDLEKDIPLIFKIVAYFFALYLILYNHSDTTLMYLLNYKLIIGMCLFYFLNIIILGDLKKYNYRDAIFLISAILLIGLAFNGFIILRNLGYAEVFYLSLIAASTDTFAYFIGSLCGKHKIPNNQNKELCL